MDAKLNHSDLSALLAKQAEISGAKAELFTKAFFDIILEGLEKDGMVKINGLGTFKVTDVASRSSVNVNTGEKIEIKGHKKLTFLPADALKEKVNQPFAMFEPVEIDDSYVDDSEEPAEGEEIVQNESQPVADDVQSEALPEVETIAEEPQAEETTTASEETVADTAETIETANEEIAQEEPSIEEVVPAAEETNKEEPAADIAEEPDGNGATEEAVNKIKNSYPLTDTAKADETEEKKGGHALLYTLLIICAILIALAIYFYPVLFGKRDGGIKPVAHATSNTAPAPAKVVETIVPDTATVAADVAPAPKEEEYAFTMVEELAARSVGSIGRGDTLLYVADGAIATHTVAADETLVRIALKYYGDKRLWPYIVQYNKLDNPNGLSKGMELQIPRLQPAK
ncbi:MAG: HU family DNA-binding protein [Bacteroidaceae bacterium]|nr:HU family DNA-binding protein [Bacteroidaceae bacterium]